MQNLRWMLAILLCMSGTFCVSAQDRVTPILIAADKASVESVIPAKDLEAFVDGLVRAQQRNPGTAGFVVTVVDRNGAIMSKGYGIAKQNPDKAVSPSESLFRIGSISKTFTYLSALRLIEEGKMHLDDDVNQYLSAEAKIPDQGYGPIRIRHLLTHTAGFEDLALGHLFVDKPERVLSIEQYLVQHRPARVRPTGKYAVYSNYSVALLGHVIEKVSGESFDTHIEKGLLTPIKMLHSTFREPLNENDPRHISGALKAAFPSGFSRGTGEYTPQGPEYIAQIGPAGGMSSTGDDMGRYMRMLLNEGAIDGVQVLPVSALKKLDKPLFRNAEEVAGFSYGFFRRRYGDVESLEHGGATLNFHSNMVVLPSLGIGVFVSTNTDNGRPFSESLPRLIFERYLPSTRPAPLPAANKAHAEKNQRYAGTYRTTRRAYKGLEGFVGLFESETSIGVDAKGDVLITAAGQSSRWRELSPNVFAEVEGINRLRFFEDKASGAITGLTSGYGHTVSEKIGFWQTMAGLYTSMGALVLGALIVLRRAWRRRREPVIEGWSRKASRMLSISAIAWLVFIGVLLYALISLSSEGDSVLYHFPNKALVVSTWLGRMAAALSLLSAFMLPGFLFDRYYGLGRRMLALIWVLIMLLASWLLWNSQLIAF
jgi:CubicO group peptidase (beta-lactamase class C family)